MTLEFTDYDTRLGAYGVVVDDDRVLLARWNAPSGDMWILPGGGVEFGESPEQGLVREFEEETGYDVECGTLLDIRTSTIPAEQRFVDTDRPMRAVQVFYTARILGGTLRDELDGSTDAAAWFPIADLPTIRHAQNVEHALELATAVAAARGGVTPSMAGPDVAPDVGPDVAPEVGPDVGPEVSSGTEGVSRPR